MNILEFKNLSKNKRGRPEAKRCLNVDGTMCDSVTERDFYNMLKSMGLDFQFQHEIMLIGPTRPREPKTKKNPVPLFVDRCAEAVTMKVDFVLAHDGITYYLDTKGSKKHVKEASKMRYDMLKHKLDGEGLADVSRVLFISRKEVDELCQYAQFDRTNFWNKFKTIKERI